MRVGEQDVKTLRASTGAWPRFGLATAQISDQRRIGLALLLVGLAISSPPAVLAGPWVAPLARLHP